MSEECPDFEKILVDRVKGMNDEELYKSLKEFYPGIGPVIPNTRSVYQKKLMRFIRKAGGDNLQMSRPSNTSSFPAQMFEHMPLATSSMSCSTPVSVLREERLEDSERVRFEERADERRRIEEGYRETRRLEERVYESNMASRMSGWGAATPPKATSHTDAFGDLPDSIQVTKKRQYEMVGAQNWGQKKDSSVYANHTPDLLKRRPIRPQAEETPQVANSAIANSGSNPAYKYFFIILSIFFLLLLLVYYFLESAIEPVIDLE